MFNVVCDSIHHRLRQLHLLFEVDVEPLHFLVERGAVDAQLASRVLAIPAVGFQGVNDQLPFRTRECRLQIRTCCPSDAVLEREFGAVFN